MAFSEVVSAPAWRAEAEDWVRAQVAESGGRVVGDITQPRVRPWSTQLVVPTDAGRLWFKANCPALAFEPAVHRTLARLDPGEVDEPVAVDAERGWMLTRDRGTTLGDSHEATSTTGGRSSPWPPGCSAGSPTTGRTCSQQGCRTARRIPSRRGTPS